MKVLRILTVALFVLTLCLFGWFYLEAKKSVDYTLPRIRVEQELLELSIHDGDEVLLQGITAYDDKDGDLSHKVIVESVSQFTGDNTCVVTYAVADSDKHVAKCTRKIRYTDYEKPVFYLNQSMVFPVGASIDIGSVVGAVDCIEGDISDRVIIAATDYQANVAGVYSLSLQATNAKGDIVYLELSLYAEEENLRAPEIKLKDYLIYVKKGETPDFMSYVEAITSPYGIKIEGEEPTISHRFDGEKPGVYDIHYNIQDVQGNEAHTVLTVVVEE